MRSDLAALDQVVDGPTGAAAEEAGGGLDVEEAVIAALLEQTGDVLGEQFELLACELDRQGE